MTGIERIARIMKRQPVDRIGMNEEFWFDTRGRWVAEGDISADTDLAKHFNFDIEKCWPLNLQADLDHKDKIIDENDATETFVNGNYVTVIRHKNKTAVPGYLDWGIKTRADWEEKVKPLLRADRRRADAKGYREVMEYCHSNDMAFAYGGLFGWEAAVALLGQHNLLMTLAEDPQWAQDVIMTYSRLIIDLQQQLYADCGKPDVIWLFEDMGYKGRPFFSPRMYRELIMPAHKMACDYAKSINVPVVMHSCGFIEPLLPYMIEAGIDCLQAIEIKAGMDLLRIHKNYGERLSFIGGIDAMVLETNDKKLVEAELLAKVPFVKKGFGYILHSDHSVSSNVDYDTFKYFVERGMELGQY